VINQRNEVPGPAVTVEWTVDTIAPKLNGQVRAKPPVTTKKGRPRSWILASAFDRSLGKPAALEFSTAKKKPATAAGPVKVRTRKWEAKLTIKSRAKPTWVRVFDGAGNRSPWVKVK
jgi:hypothetical protein